MKLEVWPGARSCRALKIIERTYIYKWVYWEAIRGLDLIYSAKIILAFVVGMDSSKSKVRSW